MRSVVASILIAGVAVVLGGLALIYAGIYTIWRRPDHIGPHCQLNGPRAPFCGPAG
jgi:hypothetical protein